MKYIHPSLEEVVPLKLRIKIYKEALKYYKEPSDNFYSGLCILLPMLLWELDSYLNDAPNGNSWNWSDTSTAFPEIDEYLFVITDCNDSSERRKLRIKILTSILKKLL